MDIVELKANIEQNKPIQYPLILNIKDDSSKFIAKQYVIEIARYSNLDISYINTLESIKKSAFSVEDKYLYVYDTTLAEDNKELSLIGIQTNNLIIITTEFNSDTYNKYVVDIPKLEDWQIKDYIYSNLEGINNTQIDSLCVLFKNIYKLDAEKDRINIFPANYQKHMFDEFINSGLYKNESVDLFTIVNSILSKNINSLQIAPGSVDVFPLMSLLHNNILILLDLKSIRGKTSLTKQQYVLSKYKDNFTENQLISMLKLIGEIDLSIKTNKISSDIALEIFIYKIIGIINENISLCRSTLL